MKACQNCGKAVVLGKSGVHQYGGGWARRGPKTKRIWKANLHRARIKVGPNFKTMILCTKCLRKFKKTLQVTTKSIKGVVVSQSNVARGKPLRNSFSVTDFLPSIQM